MKTSTLCILCLFTGAINALNFLGVLGDVPTFARAASGILAAVSLILFGMMLCGWLLGHRD